MFITTQYNAASRTFLSIKETLGTIAPTLLSGNATVRILLNYDLHASLFVAT